MKATTVTRDFKLRGVLAKILSTSMLGDGKTSLVRVTRDLWSQVVHP
jgi:hypothetical protein